MKKVLFIFTALYLIILFIFIKLFYDYEEKILNNYLYTIKKEISILIKEHLDHSLTLAKSFLANDDIIQALKTQNYQKLDYLLNHKYKINIIDNNGILKYSTFATDMINKDITKVRHQIKEVLSSKKPIYYINSGVYGISIKGDIPIIIEHQIKGVLEIIIDFKSIVKELQKQHIYSAIVLAKDVSKKVKFKKLGFFKNGYFILNYSSKEAIRLLDGVEKFLNKSIIYYKGYFIVKVPIKSKEKTIAYIISFVKDINNIKRNGIFLQTMIIILAISFFIVATIAFILLKNNEKIIKDLNATIKREIKKNIDLLYIDSLTNAYKKSKFDIDKHLYHNLYAVMLNIKNFSKINELYGFKMGDKLLKKVATRLKEILKTNIYRIAADEFAFFTNDYQKDIDKIIHSFRENPIEIDDLSLRVAFAFAVSKNSGDDTLRKLSIAIKEARDKIFQKYVIYDEKPLKHDFVEFNTLLYDALYLEKEAQIIPMFQPIIDNNSQKPVKYEVLARLKTKDKIYTPFFFLDVARSSGFLPDLTKKIIEKSFKIAKEKGINISINITDEDLLMEGFKEFLMKKLKENGLKPQNVTLEILENITSKDANKSTELIRKLKDEGFLIAIDDFGVEYSNFERISDLDVDFIKIDGKYIKNINNKKHYQIVQAITNFAKSMDIKVIAEFVENEEIFKKVKELKIDYSQGYYFSPPIDLYGKH